MSASSSKLTHTEILLTDLHVAYPALDPQVVSKSTTSYVDDPDVASELIGIVIEDCLILDPSVSDCGRFEVNSHEAYGVPASIANRIKVHNQIA